MLHLRSFLILLMLFGCKSNPTGPEPDTAKLTKESKIINENIPENVLKEFETKAVPAEKVRKKMKKEKATTAKVASEEKTVSLPKNKCETAYPFKEGEQIVLDASYFLVSAGKATLTVGAPTVIKNRPVMTFNVKAETYPKFSKIVYRAVEDIHAFVDLENFFSYKFTVDRDETKVTGKRVELYDHEKKESYYWHVRDHITKGHEEKKYTSALEPGSLDPMSVLFYARCLDIRTLGKDYYVPIHTEGKNRVAYIKVIDKEVLDTPIGKIPSVILSARMILNGVLQTDDAFQVWFSDDERKIPVKLKVKVKIGSVEGNILEYKEGTKSLL